MTPHLDQSILPWFRPHERGRIFLLAVLEVESDE